MMNSMKICVSACCFSQEKESFHFTTRVVYKMTYQPDSTDASSITSEYMELLYGDSGSIFRAIKMGRQDSIKHVISKSKGKYREQLTPEQIKFIQENTTPVNYTIFKIADHMLVRDNYLNGGYDLYKYYPENDWDLNWDFGQNTVTHIISNFICEKAVVSVGGREWAAWFTPEIPIFDGPYKFKGLPGLILKVSDAQSYWQFDLVSITHVDCTLPVLDNEKEVKRRLLPKKTFFAEKKYYTANSTIMDESAGRIFIFDPEVRRKAIEKDRMRAKKDNNWIELFRN